ncbi:MAG TPA: hypothetical protein VIG61_01535 [Fusobacterium sp.]|uniref:hypothetical protein n=1 Tax=Fusobacterium sp. TaxID=68766 RepID=UPI002F3FF833
MKKVDAFICGIASISCLSSSTLTDVVKEFPSSYEKNTEKSLQDSWMTVGKALKGAIDNYGSKTKKSNR